MRPLESEPLWERWHEGWGLWDKENEEAEARQLDIKGPCLVGEKWNSNKELSYTQSLNLSDVIIGDRVQTIIDWDRLEEFEMLKTKLYFAGSTYTLKYNGNKKWYDKNNALD